MFPVSGTCHPGLFPETTGLGDVVAADTSLVWLESRGTVVGEGMPSSRRLLGGICLLAVSSKAGTGLRMLEGRGDPNAPIPSLMEPTGESSGVR